MARIPLFVAAVLSALPFVSSRSLAQVAETRAAPATAPQQGRAAFERAWESWASAPEGPAKVALALEVDRLAAQRYATVSRLYWHRDLASAIEAAEASGRPILALRMLGNLDEDLSCANSRFFRVVLYANESLSGYLREHFELLWTSERPVPRVTIDFGDGRVLERTVTGNSAHFVLDSRGRPVDVIPGLYGPATFGRLLREAEVVARDVARYDDEELTARLASHHRERFQTLSRVRQRIGPIDPITGSPLMAAERTTFGKFLAESITIAAAGLDPSLTAETMTDLLQDARLASVVPAKRTEALDAASRALFARLAPADWSRPGEPLDGDALESLAAAFERILFAESARNEESFHAAVHGWYVTGRAPRDLAALSAKVYTELFLTPASDRWLGLSTPGVFSALPGDGVILTNARER